MTSFAKLVSQFDKKDFAIVATNLSTNYVLAMRIFVDSDEQITGNFRMYKSAMGSLIMCSMVDETIKELSKTYFDTVVPQPVEVITQKSWSRCYHNICLLVDGDFPDCPEEISKKIDDGICKRIVFLKGSLIDDI